MIPKLQHTMIRASAGTGKTYQLANRFIALLLLQAADKKAAPERLVALTFTRKGAAEFAVRILNRLAMAAASTDGCSRLRGDIEEVIQGDPAKGIKGLAPGAMVAVDPAGMRQLLAAVADELDRLSLGTIDSFMARSVQTLAFELGLGGFEILEGPATEIARRELLAQVFDEAADSDIDAFYQTFKRATLKSSSSLRREMDQFVQSYHGLVCAVESAAGWGGPDFWPEGLPSCADTQWRVRAETLRQRICGTSYGHKSLTKSLCTALDWLAKRNVETAPGRPPTWLGDDGKLCQIWSEWPPADWSLQYQRKQCTIPGAVMAELRDILQAWTAAEKCALAGKTQALFQMVSAYEKIYEQQARRKGRLSFADLPLLLEANAEIRSTQAIALLGFRWFQQIDHWLLDEFQDTSRSQWSVLHPWLDEAIQDNSGTKSVFVVGDLKQSIYGWRGGEPRLFQELVTNYRGAFHEQLMSESWRSRPAVLDLVNRVCSPHNPAFADPDKFSPRALSRWCYENHVCSKDRGTRSGYAAVLLAAKEPNGLEESPEPQDGDVVDEKLAPRARVIKAVLAGMDPLGKGLSCAILTRKGKHALAIAQWLRANGVTNVMVEGDATLADQSPVLAALVDALRWLDTPADHLAEGHVLLSPLWQILEESVAMANGAERPRGTVWRYWRQRVCEIGAASVTREWCAVLMGGQLSAYGHYCLQQVDQLAHRVGAQVTLAEWIVTLERFTVRETSSAGSVHVMTIHKAKGLGFDVVFLPDLDMGRYGGDQVLLRKDSQGVITGCLVSPPKWLTTWMPDLAELKTEQISTDDLEELCVLYVALTRAKEATFVVMGKETNARTVTRTRDWIMGGVRDSGSGPSLDSVTTEILSTSRWGAGEVLWETGVAELKMVSDASVKALPYQPGLQLPKLGLRRERKRPSDAGHRRWQQQEAPLSVPSFGGLDFGTEVHQVFEQIEWWDPRLILQGTETAVSLVHDCLAFSEIRALFDQETPRDEAQQEVPVEFIENDVWWSGVIDRIVLRHNAEGKLVRVIIVDFKTDKVVSAEALRDLYSDQLDLYRRALSLVAGFGGVPIETVLLSTHLKALVPIIR